MYTLSHHRLIGRRIGYATDSTGVPAVRLPEASEVRTHSTPPADERTSLTTRRRAYQGEAKGPTDASNGLTTGRRRTGYRVIHDERESRRYELRTGSSSSSSREVHRRTSPHSTAQMRPAMKRWLTSDLAPPVRQTSRVQRTTAAAAAAAVSASARIARDEVLRNV